jgi:phosphatidylserine/phosphatidylglycerophosphate/cardiolipin synthase-like enzyme
MLQRRDAMKMMNRNTLVFSGILSLTGCAANAPPAAQNANLTSITTPKSTNEKSTIEIVESAPLETTLDHADVPNTDQVWLDMIAHAQRSISLAIFYASTQPGDRLEPIVKAIEAAAARNVDVRLVFDASFYEKNKDVPNRLAANPSIKVRLIDIKSRTNGVLHAKYFIVDDVDTYVGSANFDGRALEHIQEIGVRVKDRDIARTLDQVFRYDWRDSQTLDPKSPLKQAVSANVTVDQPAPQSYAKQPLALPLPNLPVTISHAGEETQVTPLVSPRRLMPEGYASLDELPHLVRAIDGAKTSIDLQLLTYSINTDDIAHKFLTLDDALRRADARGVTVRMLVSDWNLDDNKIESLRELARSSKIKIDILTIPPFSSGFIPYARVSHAKYMVVDAKESWVGSSNWEESYFTRTRNIGLMIDGSKFAGELETIFTSGWTSAYAKPFDVNATYTPRKRSE